MAAAPPASTGVHRVAGLDSIRFVCAAIVALGHFGPYLRPALEALLGPRLGDLAATPIGILFNGPAAVIVFFVLSGFVVHLPQTEGRPFGTAEYFARRYLRIGPPALIAWLLYALLQSRAAEIVLWSIVCELIYYTLYPVLLRAHVPILSVLRVSFVAALALALLGADLILTRGGEYPALGDATWVLGAPCWLAGCWLAERYRRFPIVAPRAIWAARAAILALSVALLVLRFHAPRLGVLGSYPVTLTLFAIPATLWLGLEAQFRRAAPPALDGLGRASYSLYLAHPMVLAAFAAYFAPAGAAAPLLYVLLVACCTALFYLLVERPSHIAARWSGRRLRQRAAIASGGGARIATVPLGKSLEDGE